MSESAPASSSHTRRMPRGFEAFACVPFRWLIAASLSFFLAMQGQILVRSLLAWELTQSELSLAWVNLVVALPMTGVSFLAGAIIDRVERRRLLMIAQILIMINELALLMTMLLDRLNFPMLLVSSFL